MTREPCRVPRCCHPAIWSGWMPKPNCRARVLIPANVCAEHKALLVRKGTLSIEPLQEEASHEAPHPRP